MFEIGLDLEKAWTDEGGVMRFRCKASSPALDKQGERMTERALQKMASFTNLELRALHGGLTELGTVDRLWKDGTDVIGEGRLDGEHPEAARIYKRMQNGKGYQLSVGGKVTNAFWRFDKEAGRNVRYLDDIELDHIALCPPGKAANPDTWIMALAKAMDEEWPEDLEQTNGMAPEADDVAKAGARHSKADTQALHSAMDHVAQAHAGMKDVCGCADCSGNGAVEKSDDGIETRLLCLRAQVAIAKARSAAR